VLDFYRRFLERFPDLHALAQAKPQRVLEAWEGLGYYARARNLHKLAKHVTETRAGVIPSEPEDLRALPGVGAYTAGAVASFAYEKRAALVDTNVARVLHRVFAPDLDPKSGAGLKRLWQIAEQLLPRTGKVVWTHNQALMELGALVCSARSPKCGACPVHRVCASRDRFMATDPVVPLTKKRTRRAVKPE
jgi:A/G-specific adenine glycosylase